jgi:purine nucleosidase
VPLDQGVQNALYTVELCGASVPVYAGSAAPLNRPLETAQLVHGEDGMGDIGLPLSGRTAAGGAAVETMIATISQYPGEITLVTLGPLTNLAMALRQDPTVATQVAGCVIMGGTGFGPGNISDNAEYNIWVDPEAAAVVLASGMPITMVGWDVSCRFATVGPDEAQRLRDIGTDLARFCVDIQATLTKYATEVSRLEGFDLPDPLAMAIAIDPQVAVRSESVHVLVGTEGTHRGATFAGSSEPANADVVVEADRQRFLKMLRAAVS